MNFYTCGEDEVRAWTVHVRCLVCRCESYQCWLGCLSQRGVKAPQAAAAIHTDFEKFFISADVFNYADLKELGTENAVKAAGKLRMQGREYVVQESDVLHIKHNAKK